MDTHKVTSNADDLKKEIEHLKKEVNGLYKVIEQITELDNGKLIDALVFYADPDTYFAIGFFPDPPCGPFMEDFSETPLGDKPGKLARTVLGLED